METVADSQNGNAQGEDFGGRDRGAFFVDALGAAREDDPLGPGVSDLLDGSRRRPNLRIDPQLADLAGDELGILRPEIKNQDFVHEAIVSSGARVLKGSLESCHVNSKSQQAPG